MDSPQLSNWQRATPPPLITPAAAVRLGIQALTDRAEAEAIPILSEVRRLHPGEAALSHMLGLLHFELGEHEPAFTAMDTALALKPNDTRLVHARAHMALEAGEPSLAWFDRAHRLSPDDASILLGRLASQIAEGQARAADNDLTDILRRHPGWIEGHAALMRLRFSLAQTEDWQGELNRALAQHPGDPRLHHLKIIALHRAHLGQDALEAASVALRVAGEFPQTRAAAAMVATEYGHQKDAEAAFAGLDKISDRDLALHWCRLLARKGEWAPILAFAQGVSGDLLPTLQPYVSIAARKLALPGADPGDAAYVKIIDFGADWAPLGELADLLRALHLAHAQPLDQSVRGGTQTDGPLLKRQAPIIRQLRDRFMAEIRAYIASLPPRDASHPFLGRIPREPRFSGSWSVRIANGGHHDPHVHDQGWLSSVFYVHIAAKEGASIGTLTLGEPQPSLETGLPPLLTVEPVQGRLVLFPSHLWHGTREFEGEERLTIAFDVA